MTMMMSGDGDALPASCTRGPITQRIEALCSHGMDLVARRKEAKKSDEIVSLHSRLTRTLDAMEAIYDEQEALAGVTEAVANRLADCFATIDDEATAIQEENPQLFPEQSGEDDDDDDDDDASGDGSDSYADSDDADEDSNDVSDGERNSKNDAGHASIPSDQSKEVGKANKREGQVQKESRRDSRPAQRAVEEEEGEPHAPSIAAPAVAAEQGQTSQQHQVPQAQPKLQQAPYPAEALEDSVQYPVVCCMQACSAGDIQINASDKLFLIELESNEPGYSLCENSNDQQFYLPTNLLATADGVPLLLPAPDDGANRPANQQHMPTQHEVNIMQIGDDENDSDFGDDEVPFEAHEGDDDDGDDDHEHGALNGTGMNLGGLAGDELDDQNIRKSLYAHAPRLAQLQYTPYLSLGHCVGGHLTLSGLHFDDLSIETQQQTFHPSNVAISTIVQLQQTKGLQLPEHSSDVDVAGRVIRMVLFDGDNYLGNVLEHRATGTKKASAWKFDKPAFYEANAKDNYFLIRSQSSSPNLSLVFELSVITGEPNAYKEESIGWSRLVLFRADGRPVQTSQHSLQLYTGSPDSPKQDVKAIDGALLQLKVASYNKAKAVIIETLPKDIVVRLNTVAIISIYRGILASIYLKQLRTEATIPPVCNPLLYGFPRVADSPSLLNTFCRVWESALKRMKKADKRDRKQVWMLFQIVFSQKIWPLLLTRHRAARWHSVVDTHRATEPFPLTHAMDVSEVQSFCSAFTRTNDAQALTLTMREQNKRGVHFAPFSTQAASFAYPFQVEHQRNCSNHKNTGQPLS